VTDNKSNTYTVNATSATYTGCNLFAAYSFGAATGITSFIVTYTGSGGTGITAYDCGSTSGGAFDAIAGLSSQSSANPAPSITAAAAGIALTILGAGSNASAVAAPFILDTTGNQFAGFNYGSHDVNGAGGSLTSTFTATNASWCSLMATFKEVSAPASGPANLLIMMGCGT
jgi:hypothetical protein